MTYPALDPAVYESTDSAGTGPANAARRLYDAEIALHIARQTRVDSWVAAAYDRLHLAVEADRAARLAT